MNSLAQLAGFEPVHAVIAAIGCACLLAGWGLRTALGHAERKDPLEGLFDRTTFEKRIDAIPYRPAPPAHAGSPLRGQRAQMVRLMEVWDLEIREEAIEEIARVMRASTGRPANTAHARLKGTPARVASTEWEEVKLLPPPPSPGQSTSQAA